MTVLIPGGRPDTVNKSEVLAEFSSDPDRYYSVELFRDAGFERRPCRTCGRFFWTLDTSRAQCPDDAPDTYSFIGDPPTSRRFDYTEAWRQIRSFFEDEHGHAAIGRYPVVCRWRDDLYFTIASIVDFQRVMGSKVVFEFPANPLVVPQTCLRFKDLENVGVTGRHFSSFCMVGQHSVPDMPGGYWKDECIRLDYSMLTGRFGIPPEEIVFVEDVWAGGGSFGPSLEYFVRGLELGNAVFTEFQGELGRHTTLDRRIIDMGAGLERLAWITMGTPTAYDCCFGGGINTALKDALGIDADARMLGTYYSGVARMLDKSDDLWQVRRRALKDAGISDDLAARTIEPLEGAYLIADHLRTLVFAIADGALPSNVGGGYNLRMMLRRVAERMRLLGLSGMVRVEDLVDAHIDYLAATYPELDGRRGDIKQILAIEGGRFAESRSKMQRKVARVHRRRDGPDTDALITLYESDGITPEHLVEEGVIPEVPPEFYSRLSELHQSDRRAAPEEIPGLECIPDTELLFYGDDQMDFGATVLWSCRGMVALDRTSFYARGGGQEPDHGTIDGLRVTDVTRHAGVILHAVERVDALPRAGQNVRCVVDAGRRDAITRNHTSTHILNASSRAVLGSWVWQHSAFKDADHARLDITHHSPLTARQVERIEDAANGMVSDNLPVSIRYMERGAAEQRYGFSIYQGGVVPVRAVRIVAISDRDVEACGGTHVGSTGQIRKIRITRTKRIQDGVVRLEFVSGDAAEAYDARREEAREAEAEEEARREATRRRREEAREEARTVIPDLVGRMLADAGGSGDQEGTTRVGGMSMYKGSAAPARVCMLADYTRNERFHTALGKRLVKASADSAYVGFFESGPTTRIVVYVGAEAARYVDAPRITAAAAAVLGGGSSSGDPAFSQGGGTDASRRGEAEAAAEAEIREMLSLPPGGRRAGAGEDGSRES